MATVTIVNLTRPGSLDFFVGDRWLITITGAVPNGTVTAESAYWEGVTTFGVTDSSGNFRIIGTMGREDIALWTEFWYVNGVACTPTLQFRVRPSPVSPSDLTFTIPDDDWSYGVSGDPLNTTHFISDDGPPPTVFAKPANLIVGKVFVGGLAMPWNTMSSAIGNRMPTRSRSFIY